MNVDTIRVTEVLVLDKADVVMRQDGYMTANPRVGRIGIQIYGGKELGRPDMERVRVWRPESEVMDKSAMASIAHRPITNDHPKEPVTADNWKKYAVGQTGDTVARDGEFVRVPMMLADAGVIRDFHDGKKELSLGYTSNLEWRSGKTDQGEEYDAVQTMIRVNHLAVVDAARGGPKLRIGDGASIDQSAVDKARKLIADKKVERDKALTREAGKEYLFMASIPNTDATKYPFVHDGKVYRSALESIKVQAAADQEQPIVTLCDELLQLIDKTKRKDKAMSDGTEKQTTIMVDGVSLTMSDIAASVVLRRVKALEEQSSDLRSKLEENDKKTKKMDEDHAAAIKDLTTKSENKDAEIVTLKKQVEDSKLTPEKIDQLVKDRAETAAKAKIILGDKLVVDGKSEADMRKQVVIAKLGDAAKDWTDDQVRTSFVTLTADIKPQQVADAAGEMRATFSGQPVISDTQAAREKPYVAYEKRLGDAWKNPDQRKAS